MITRKRYEELHQLIKNIKAANEQAAAEAAKLAALNKIRKDSQLYTLAIFKQALEAAVVFPVSVFKELVAAVTELVGYSEEGMTNDREGYEFMVAALDENDPQHSAALETLTVKKVVQVANIKRPVQVAEQPVKYDLPVGAVDLTEEICK